VDGWLGIIPHRQGRHPATPSTSPTLPPLVIIPHRQGRHPRWMGWLMGLDPLSLGNDDEMRKSREGWMGWRGGAPVYGG
jgi:hypothetical protein